MSIESIRITTNAALQSRSCETYKLFDVVYQRKDSIVGPPHPAGLDFPERSPRIPDTESTLHSQLAVIRLSSGSWL